MQRDRLGRRGRARITAEEYNHSLSKLVSTKKRVKPSRKAAFMAAFPVRASPRLHPDEEGASVLPLKEASITDSGHSTTPNTNETISTPEVNRPVGVRHKLQIFVQGLFLPKTLCLQLDPETSVSALKAHIQAESGIQPQDQRLYIGRNFQLCDLLSIRDHGIQQDQNIKLRTGGLLGGGPLEEHFSKLSRKLGQYWKPLARKLNFEEGEIYAFQENDRGNLHEQIFQMLNAWWKRQDIPADAPEKLRDALKDVGRADLASQVQDAWWKKQDNPADTTEKMSDALTDVERADLAPQEQGTAKPRFDVEQCAKELAAHYRGTMKVTTHPKEKHLAREIDDICINLQLLQETNVPSPVSSSEAKMQAETGRKEEYSKRGTSVPPSSQPDRDKGFHVQKMSLDSYKDMLVLKSNRLLIRAEAGYGKTTLLKRIAYDWADLKTKGDDQTENQQPEHKSVLKRYELVFVIEVNRMGKNFNIVDAIFSQILTDSRLKKKDLEQYIHENQERILILFDGADEVSLQRVKDAQCEKVIDLNGVLSFKLLKSCKVIVTSRQKTANELLDMHAHYTKINMMGFDENDRRKYVRKYFAKFEPDNQNNFLEKVNGCETLRSLAEIPLFLWMMCHTWAEKGKLPDQITSLFRDNIQLLIQHKASKETDEHVSDTKKHVSQLGQIALEGLLNSNGEKLHFVEDEIDSKDLEILDKGSDVGLLTKRKDVQGLKTVCHFSFLHKTFQEYVAAAYLADLFRINRKTFDQYLSRIFHGDVESLEYILRFCCGLNPDAAKEILRRMTDLLKQNELNKHLHRISMLLLSEAQSESIVKYFLETVKIEFPYKLQGEVLVAANYFFQVGSNHTILHKVDKHEINATCRGLADLKLLEDVMSRIQCQPSLNIVLHGIGWDKFVDNASAILKYLNSLEVHNCDWNLEHLFQALSKTNTQRVEFCKINLHDTLSEQNIKQVPSLKECCLIECGLTNSDIEPLFSLLSSAGSIQKIHLRGNNLHGLQEVKIACVSTLECIELYESDLTASDVKPLFSLLSSAGSIKQVHLRGNNLHDLQPDTIARFPSLVELQLLESSLTKSDIEALFCLLSSLGSIKNFGLQGNNLRGLQPVTIASVPSLEELLLYESSLTKSDIEPLFSLLSSAGSIKRLVLRGNNLHGLQPVTIARVPFLEELLLQESSLSKSDIKPLFSLLSSAGSIKALDLRGNNLHGLQPLPMNRVPSLEELFLFESCLTNSDIVPLFSLLSSATRIKTVVLEGNNLHGLQPVTIASVPSLEI